MSRRQFLNRAVLGVSGFSAGVLGIGILGFLWPTGASGFGGKVNAGSLDEILAEIADKREPQVHPGGEDLPAAVPAGRPARGREGAVLQAGASRAWSRASSRCTSGACTSGCRVPWCQSSQWFECPCHGSKYNAVGEKRDGPAPRGLDRFVVAVEGGDVIIDTGVVITGPPIGTNTTKQGQEGPSCI